MKTQASPSLVLLSILCSAATAGAQLIGDPHAHSARSDNKASGLELADRPSFAADQSLSVFNQLPAVQKTAARLAESTPEFVRQDVLTLSSRRASSRRADSVLDLSVLLEPSAYRNASRIRIKVSDAQATGIHAGLEQISAAYQKPGRSVDSADCGSVAMSVEHRIKMDTSMVLEIVESEISANQNCACEIVKIAIKASDADELLVADITEVAITAAPQSMRMISQCAIAALPSALPEVQAVLARLDPHSGDSSSSKGAKSAKSAKDHSAKGAKAQVASIVSPPEPPANPLDLPPPLFPPLGPPPIIPPPDVTNPNP